MSGLHSVDVDLRILTSLELGSSSAVKTAESAQNLEKDAKPSPKPEMTKKPVVGVKTDTKPANPTVVKVQDPKPEEDNDFVLHVDDTQNDLDADLFNSKEDVNMTEAVPKDGENKEEKTEESKESEQVPANEETKTEVKDDSKTTGEKSSESKADKKPEEKKEESKPSVKRSVWFV